ncbi:hypothetical protein COM13_21730 [Bacillus pseudomycoides]|nr:hypothetical protein COM13_21730 [Bacillus pseudomycoides]PGS03556.1 hypothetical protein COC54_16235 [Bacillus pseudomycoides]PHE53964.1 hypothetical protein COF52_22755 [Bacillus pseudomycoides]
MGNNNATKRKRATIIGGNQQDFSPIKHFVIHIKVKKKRLSPKLRVDAVFVKGNIKAISYRWLSIVSDRGNILISVSQVVYISKGIYNLWKYVNI